MNEKMPFGDVLKKIRYDKRMSQKEFADILGTSKQVISRYENNQRTPQITVVEQFANKLNLPIGYFVGKEHAAGYVSDSAKVTYMSDGQKELLEELEGLSKESMKLLIELIRAMKSKN